VWKYCYMFQPCQVIIRQSLHEYIMFKLADTLRIPYIITNYTIHTIVLLTCRVVHVTKRRVLVRMIGFTSPSVTHSLLITLTYKQYSTIADLQNLQHSIFTIYTSFLSLYSQLLNPPGLSTPSSNLLFQLMTDWLRCSHFSYKPSAWAMQETEPLYCCGNVFTSLLHGNSLGTDLIEKAVHPLLLTLCCRRYLAKANVYITSFSALTCIIWHL
jgi:hypothetical protein